MTSRLDASAREAIDALGVGEVRYDEPLMRHTTLKIGGPADAWVAPDSVVGVAAICQLAVREGWPVTAIGGGSNLLVRDGGVRGIVLSTRRLRGLERLGATGIRVEAGVSTGKLLSSALTWGLGGVEFLGGVPGSVGGGLVMNAGTYLGEFVDVTREVESVRIATGERVVRDGAACGFRYRGSDLPGDEVVVRASLELCPRSREEMERAVRSLRTRRDEREPHKVSNAGSVFKNPEGDYAGRLLEAAGMKGRRVGAAECSPVHANWFVNTGGATAADLLTLIDMGRDEVKRAHGVELQLEWKIIGEDPGES